MSKVLVTESNLQDIASAIRSKNQGFDAYRPGDMAAAILAIPTGSASTLVSKTITQNGEYDPEDDNADGYSDVTVNVPNSYVAEDEGKVVSSGALVAQTSTTLTENGTYDTTENDEVVVNVSSGGSNLYTNDIIIPRGFYTFNTPNERLCTANGRGYYKTTSDPAYGCYEYNGNGTPFLISTNPDAVIYRADSGGPFSYSTTFTHEGTTYYVSSKEHGWSGAPKNTNGPLINYEFTTSISDRVGRGLEFLTFILSLSDETMAVYRITQTGIISPPTGYDGFGMLYIP